jgi:glutamine cyclotransferase
VTVAGGSVWVGSPGNQALLRVDPETGAVVATVELGARPGLVVSGEGRLLAVDERRGVAIAVDPATGAVEAQATVDPSLFAEGLALADGRLVQLTWREGRALLWDPERLTVRGEFRYEGEGWGLCYDGRQLVMSDGSNRLVRRDVRTFDPIGEIAVRSPEGPVYQLNELECVGNAIYANVWQTSRIARIDASTGNVTAWIEAAGLLTAEEAARADVLNGIARLPSGRFVLTGKLWPRAFEVEFVPAG